MFSESGASVQILSQVSLVICLNDSDSKWELMEILRPLDEHEGWIAVPRNSWINQDSAMSVQRDSGFTYIYLKIDAQCPTPFFI